MAGTSETEVKGEKECGYQGQQGTQDKVMNSMNWSLCELL